MKTWCSVKEARYKGPHIIGLCLYEMSKTGQGQAAWSQQSGMPVLESGSGHVGCGQGTDAGAPQHL